MSKDVDVTVCIPTYNEVDTLPMVLSAVKNQSLLPVEIIVVDGGSDDGTRAIAEDHEVRLLNQNDGGLSVARNIGLRNCRTDISAMIDADAVPSQYWLETSIEILESYDASVVGVEINEVGSSPSARWRQRRMPFNSLEKTGMIERIPGNNMVFRTEDFQSIGGWDESYEFANDDVDLCRRLKMAGYDIVYTPRISVDHYGVTGLDAVTQLWRWHSPDGGPDTVSELLLRSGEHVGKAGKYTIEDLVSRNIVAIPFDLAIIPIHIMRDLKHLNE